ncbi:MAG: ATP-binding protein [Bacteroidales bacterium]|nr:ATP-binding protein [Bacteroidales bacterium]
MEKDKIINPFFTGRYAGEHYFCDRERDTETLIKHIVNGRNVAIISPRRLGKSGLIHHAFSRPAIKDRYTTVYVDIYATKNLCEFAKALSESIVKAIRPENAWHERFFSFLKSLRIGFRIDSISGEPSFDIGIGDIDHPDKTIKEAFEYMEASGRPCILAIDEFQQIREYPETTAEAFIRTLVQQCSRTSFIFCGSKRHIMTDIFYSPAKPFFQSVMNQSLKPIPMETYIEFAGRLFAERGKFLDKTTAEIIYRMFDGCTWYMQMMMNELFALTEKGLLCTTEYIDIAWENIILAQEDRYQAILYSLAPKQKQLLYAIAKDGTASGITSADFIKRHGLASASSVQAALKPLLKNDIVTCEDGTYRIYDYFFADYLAKKY